MYDGTHRALVRDNYNGVAKRVAAELALLHPDSEFDAVLVARLLAHHTNALIDELKAQRDEAIAVIREVDGLHVLSSTVQFMEQAGDITGRYLYPEVYGNDEGSKAV